jgi:hypothetical protein
MGGGGGGVLGSVILAENSTDRLPKKEQLIKVSLQKLPLKLLAFIVQQSL